MLKRIAAKVGVNEKFSAHWLRHAHASHAIDHGAALPVVQSTLGHGNISVTYWLSARAARQLERPRAGSRGVSSMKIRARTKT